MRWLHRRWSRPVALLGAGALEGRERAAVVTHVGRCPACAEELASHEALWRLLDEDPAGSAELPVSSQALRARVVARLGLQESPVRPWARAVLAPSAALVTVVAVAALLVLRGGPGPQPAPEPRIEVPAAMLNRMEHRLARERAVRYLAEARDVLVNVASESPRCDRRHRRIDVEDERHRSRELLVRSALLVDVGAPTMAPARGVLEDVERNLRTVAALDPCCDPAALAALRDDLVRSRLLMKIDLVSRELVG